IERCTIWNAILREGRANDGGPQAGVSGPSHARRWCSGVISLSPDASKADMAHAGVDHLHLRLPCRRAAIWPEELRSTIQFRRRKPSDQALAKGRNPPDSEVAVTALCTPLCVDRLYPSCSEDDNAADGLARGKEQRSRIRLHFGARAGG